MKQIEVITKDSDLWKKRFAKHRTGFSTLADIMYSYCTDIKLMGRVYANEILDKCTTTNSQIREAIKKSVDDNGNIIIVNVSNKLAKPLIDNNCPISDFVNKYNEVLSQEFPKS